MFCLKRLGIVAGAMALVVVGSGCGGDAAGTYSPNSPPPPAADNYRAGYPQAAPGQPTATAEGMAAAEKEERPGLGTSWGESRQSDVTRVPFSRGDANNPFSTLAVYYNDAEGTKAMMSASGTTRPASGLFSVANGALSMGLRDENGSWLTAFTAGSKNYIVGEAGRRYTIVVRNATPFRIECVISVDGLDVIDGRDASFAKRGYLVEGNKEIEVDGFRQSANSVAAFRFGSVSGSYAEQKHGESRNVGVIGLAVFNERGTEPWNFNNDVNRRHDANPFPGQFAQPPR